MGSFFFDRQMVSSDQRSQADYRQRRRVYKRQCRIGIFGVGLVALCLVAAKASVSNNNSRITNAKRRRRSTDNLDETGGNNTANNVKWYKEPPFNYDESELTSCKEEGIYDKKEKKLKCYAKVDDYEDLADL